MIESVSTNKIEAKASKESKELLKADAQSEDTSAVANFESELQGAIAEKSEDKSEEKNTGKLKVEVTTDKIAPNPIDLLQNQSGQEGEVKAKLFDPSLTKGVEKLNSPQTTSVQNGMSNEDLMKLLQGNTKTDLAPTKDAELAKILGDKDQQKVQTGRAPAIDFAKAEIDPQLMGLDDFVAQKNLAMKKNIQAQGQAYGMKPNALNKTPSVNGLKPAQVIQGVGGEQGSSPINSQQFILNMLNEQNNLPKVNDVQAPTKVFDMSNIKTANSNQIINQISDYIIQAKASNEPSVSMRVNHDELGMIDITVARSQGSQTTNEFLNVSIGTHSIEGKNFFDQNSKDLSSHLNKAGISLAEFKVENSSGSNKSDFESNNQSFGKQSFSQDRNFGSEQNQRRHDSQRRQELWDQLYNKEAA